MIITLRGASGSGKSTLVRAVMECYPRSRLRYKEGRKKPYYAILGRPETTNLVIPGHYDIANGGVDTLKTLDEAYDIARWADSTMKYHVLMEGKCMSDGTAHVARLQHEKRDIRVVHINTSYDECFSSVRARGHQIAGPSILKTFRKIETNMETFRCMNIQIFSGNRDECLQQVRAWLGLS
jgi:ABC-type dipeptide/oligopeptide/nickel transport system ATPase component